MIADILGERMGCFLFQLPPSYRFSEARLSDILCQLDPTRRNVVEFRHRSWWNETVYSAFRKTGTIFCSCSGPRLPDDLVRTADEVYLRLHGPERWYRHDYSKEELTYGPTKSELAERRGRGFISTTTMKHLPQEMPWQCGACSKTLDRLSPLSGGEAPGA